MDACRITLPEAPHQPVHLAFSDFNRLRWALEALRVHPGLRQRLLADAPEPRLTDSIALNGGARLPWSGPATHVVLWDGLNSLIEWQALQAANAAKAAPKVLYVGQLPEAEAAMPAGAQPLYPRGDAGLPQAAAFPMPANVRWRAWARRTLRPCVQRLRQPAAHRALSEGGCLVFCGAVRHNRMLLDDSFRGARLPALRAELDDLIGLPWRTEPARAQARIRQAVTQLQRAAQALQAVQAVQAVPNATHAPEWACLFNVLNLLHRQHTLSLLAQRTERLRVIEFGQQPHFDPYDAAAYAGNAFLDFGSTVGTECLYPRRIDIERNGKAVVALRLLASGESVADWLQRQGAAGFARQSEADAERALAALRRVA
ncbi:hypothetical protein EV672_101701 [Aquabacterium commune]|uniref:Uncharacterized protein n=1 Tax=Aquabacterium commune TaxID=70586 RepID=A0A4R6RP67_9BURK|nr:hypothetical protein [Aquabacterium commune]TDP88549.1 hypothetical protein EV672_101701 [Aquabacterium commune]